MKHNGMPGRMAPRLQRLFCTRIFILEVDAVHNSLHGDHPRPPCKTKTENAKFSFFRYCCSFAVSFPRNAALPAAEPRKLPRFPLILLTARCHSATEVAFRQKEEKRTHT